MGWDRPSKALLQGGKYQLKYRCPNFNKSHQESPLAFIIRYVHLNTQHRLTWLFNQPSGTANNVKKRVSEFSEIRIRGDFFTLFFETLIIDFRPSLDEAPRRESQNRVSQNPQLLYNFLLSDYALQAEKRKTINYQKCYE